jgi:hypothetical protein
MRNPRLAVFGDRLDLFDHLTPRDDPPGISADAVIIGLLVPDAADRRTVRALVRDRFAEVPRAMRAHVGARHVIVVVRAPRWSAARTMRRVMRHAARAHAQIERETAHHAELTVLDLSLCDDSGLGASRIQERAAGACDPFGLVVVDWSDIECQSIARAAAGRYS